MSGKNDRLTPLETRKQLLLVESEVNRAQLLNECATIKSHLDALGHRVHSVTDSVHSTIGLVHNGINRMRDVVTGIGKSKSSLVSVAVNGVRIATSLWGAWRSRSR